ncbi:hypothetical protein BpHYR1_024821 [Brachionus plicatilis]|uniref:Uncharacterized protein n=1 Tax=Brachionus plicatilis TaxID=10195 RepID=A0A3M7PPU2_BRAPC|nr:hypothetical protein BpHYR1_024821 [Brachionus plicatilis]
MVQHFECKYPLESYTYGFPSSEKPSHSILLFSLSAATQMGIPARLTISFWVPASPKILKNFLFVQHATRLLLTHTHLMYSFFTMSMFHSLLLSSELIRITVNLLWLPIELDKAELTSTSCSMLVPGEAKTTASLDTSAIVYPNWFLM